MCVRFREEEEEKDRGRWSVAGRIVSNNVESVKAASSRCLKERAKWNNPLSFRCIGVTGNLWFYCGREKEEVCEGFNDLNDGVVSF